MFYEMYVFFMGWVEVLFILNVLLYVYVFFMGWVEVLFILNVLLYVCLLHVLS